MSAGVRRLVGPPADVAVALRERGWAVAVAPPARTDAELWDGLVAALDLPDWFGRNLDALDEVLGDLGGSGRPTALLLSAWWAYARARPERWQRLLGVLADHADGRRFLVALTD